MPSKAPTLTVSPSFTDMLSKTPFKGAGTSTFTLSVSNSTIGSSAETFEAADELLSLWKERTAVAQQTVKAEQTARKNQVKAASTGNVRGTGQSQRKKVYRRADIIKLMKTDPERYQTISDEILQAYSEGRVK